MQTGADETDDKVAWAGAMGAALRRRRAGSRIWRLHLIDGPNMSNLGEGGRDPRTYGTVRSIGQLQRLTAAFAEGLGAAMETYQSNHEGDIVGYIYDKAGSADAYLINPAALTRRGAPCALALVDSGRPYIELHFANIAALGWSNGALITKRASGVVMGLRHYSYVGAVFGLIGALDAGVFDEASRA